MKLKFIMILSLVLVSYAYAKDNDTLKTYRLGEIKVTDSKSIINKIQKASTEEVPYHVLQRADVNSVSDLQLYIPSGYVRTNSRGESMLFVRGAGERQLGLYFDGMSMNIPWDNRMDLSFVPADIIGNINIDKSAGSMLFGPNVLGGAVSITTLERRNPGYGLTIKAQGGNGGKTLFSALHDGKIGEFNYVANISRFSSDGDMLSKGAPDMMDNQNDNSSLRTNTDQTRLNAYIRGEYHFSESTILGLSFSHTNQEKGVAAETFEGEDARFWRYPERMRNSITLNAMHDFSDVLSFRTTVWYDNFSQKINTYSSFEYENIDEVQEDTDNTIGTRISMKYKLNDAHSLVYVLNGFTTTHNEQVNDDPEAEFSQNTISTGIEYLGVFDKIELNTGIGIDYNKTPKTGLFTEAEGNSSSDFAGFISGKYMLTDLLAITGSISRRTRFPTMREQYSGALGSFKVNPDLKPETGILNEFGFIYALDNLELKAVGFLNVYDNLIERIRLSPLEDSLERRMRVNYAEAKVSGIDLNINFQPVRRSNLNVFFTYLHTQAEQDGEEIKHLNNKPEILSGVVGDYRFDFGLKPQLEIEYTGIQYQDNPFDGPEFVEIEESVILNARIAYDINFSNFASSELYVRVNNILDEYKLSQLGLPEAGRTAYAGVMLRI